MLYQLSEVRDQLGGRMLKTQKSPGVDIPLQNVSARMSVAAVR